MMEHRVCAVCEHEPDVHALEGVGGCLLGDCGCEAYRERRRRAPLAGLVVLAEHELRIESTPCRARVELEVCALVVEARGLPAFELVTSAPFVDLIVHAAAVHDEAGEVVRELGRAVLLSRVVRGVVLEPGQRFVASVRFSEPLPASARGMCGFKVAVL